MVNAHLPRGRPAPRHAAAQSQSPPPKQPAAYGTAASQAPRKEDTRERSAWNLATRSEAPDAAGQMPTRSAGAVRYE